MYSQPVPRMYFTAVSPCKPSFCCGAMQFLLHADMVQANGLFRVHWRNIFCLVAF